MSALRSAATLSALLALPLALPAVASGRARDLTADEARRLVIRALQPAQRSLPGLELSASYDVPGFYNFAALWDPPDQESPVVGFFAVNRATGDVWEMVLCTKRTSAELRRLQDELRKRIGLTGDELRKMTDEAPCQP